MRRILFLLTSYVFVEASGALQETRTCPIGREAPIPPPQVHAPMDYPYKESCQTLKYLNASGANGAATLVADGSACVYTSTLDTCNFSQLAQVEFDVEVSGNCSEDEWLRVYFWYNAPNNTKRLQIIETNYSFYNNMSGYVFTSFGQVDKGFGSIWADDSGAPLSYGTGFKRHVTTWTSPNHEPFLINLFVKNCAWGSGTCDSGSIEKLASKPVNGTFDSLLGAVAWNSEWKWQNPGLFALDNLGTGGKEGKGNTSAGCALSVTNLSISTCGSGGQPSCAKFCLSPIAGADENGKVVSYFVVDVNGTCVATRITPRPWWPVSFSFLWLLAQRIATYWTGF